MSGFLFDDVIFGPVRSRRLGLSLGINLLPLHFKHCSFNCIYCECGWTKPAPGGEIQFPDREQVALFLEKRLQQLVAQNYLPDSLTYAGNGEPTLHPDFPGVVEDTIRLRNQFIPATKISVLSNASMTGDPVVFNALLKVDNNIQKLDAGGSRLFNLINNPLTAVDFDQVVSNLKKFNGEVIIQSMFLRGHFKGEWVDNTNEREVEQWLGHLTRIRPSMVMIYPVARATPVHNLEKISDEELQKIAKKVRKTGLNAEVF